MPKLEFNLVLEVRPITEDELPAFAFVLQDAARHLFERGLGLWPPDSLAPEALLKLYAVPEMRLGVLGHELAAAMVLQERDDLFWPEVPEGESLFLHKLAVHRNFRGRGLARAMLDAARAEAATRGKAFLRLDTAADRPKLRALYEGYGFEFVDERQVGNFQVVRYELPLGSSG